MITRKQLLFRIAIFMLFVSLLFITIFVIKLIKYCGIPVEDYEVVEANVVQYEVRDVGLEGFPRKPYEN
ncbi:MAG: hypothetical protein K6E10_04985, partial [Eubacterium sp.]|nr:hypothetical protein [Eubacterium sp.]